jgi:hypothetical protein
LIVGVLVVGAVALGAGAAWYRSASDPTVAELQVYAPAPANNAGVRDDASVGDPLSSEQSRPSRLPPLPTAVGTTVGSQRYEVPVGAVVVAKTGDDAASGTPEAPVLTVRHALSIAPDGGTIVLRGGVYHESVVIERPVTVQSWPGEQVWFDGSRRLTGWVADGDKWRLDGWDVDFDTSPTYVRGQADNDQKGWRFVNPDHPLAAHPDQVFVDGNALRQVASRDAVEHGSFFHDVDADQLFIGVDPSGRRVAASDLVRALAVRADGAVLRGFGVRRYAPSVPDMGSITLERPGIVMEHVEVADAATTGISVIARGVSLRNVHVIRSGMLGIHANQSDGLVLDHVLSENNNTELFNPAPVSGGLKVTRAVGILIESSVFRSNRGPGVWIDESTRDVKIVRTHVLDNAHHGISLEISATAVVVGSTIAGNDRSGIKINNTSDVQIWNNTIIDNAPSIYIAQDDRSHGDGSPGVDPRNPHDPAMTWLIGPVTIANNIIADPGREGCLLCVDDYTGERSPAEMQVTFEGNVYEQPSASVDSAALPLPADIAELTGRAAGTQHVGPWQA